MKTILMTAAALALTASAAFAHAHLLKSEPADKATVAAPSDLVLNFSEGVSAKFTGVMVMGADHADIATGVATLTNDDKTMTIPLKDTLKPGSYMVSWHALSNDGHKTKGSYSFTVK